jgi:hypothetical protein
MAFGSADGYEGSVAFGNVLNFYGTDLLITDTLSSGNIGKLLFLISLRANRFNCGHFLCQLSFYAGNRGFLGWLN